MKKLILTGTILLLAYLSKDIWLSWLGLLAPDQVEKNSSLIQSYTAIIGIPLTVIALFFQLKQDNKKDRESSENPYPAVNPHDFKPDPSFEPTDLDSSSEIDNDKSPYLGLSAFKAKDKNLFFGRKKDIKEAIESLKNKNWLQIEGNSGAGKSSLVSAGIIPAIKKGILKKQRGYKHWKIIHTITPGETPLKHLAEALEKSFVKDPSQRETLKWQKQLEEDERALAYRLTSLQSKNNDTAFVLFVDQFEELFTFSAKKEKQIFDAQLANALQDKDCPLFLITTVRLDFLDGFEQLPKLSELYNQHCERNLLKTMTLDGLKEAIVNPAKLAKLDVREVTDLILSDAQNEVGALPLVENALQTLWQESRRQDECRTLSGEFYRKNGGLIGLLEAQADKLLDDLDRDPELTKGKESALELLLALTRYNMDGNHTRLNLDKATACAIAGGKKEDENQGLKIIDYLTGHLGGESNNTKKGGLPLLTTLGTEDDPQISIIHETLIRPRTRGDNKASQKLIGYWKTLYNYIEKNRDREFYRYKLLQQKDSWQNSRGLTRWKKLASWRDLKHYQPLRLAKNSTEARYIRNSKLKAGLYSALLAIFIGFWGQAYVWTLNHGFPPNYMLTLQKFRLMDWGLIDEPLPEMVEIPASKKAIQIGEYDADWYKRNVEGTEFTKNFVRPLSQPVIFDKAFYLGKYEVTYEQYDYYVWQQQNIENPPEYPTSSPSEALRGERAVTSVSWNDANAYVKWLSDTTGKDYRLPTEVEWEYAARAGTNSAYWWGSSAKPDKQIRANCRNCGSEWDFKRIAPVGQFEANAFGLYDTAGNVWEWTASVFKNQYDGSENKVVDITDKSGRRVLRGGSWLTIPDWLRSSSRGRFNTDYRNNNVGFRVYGSPRTN